MTVICAGIRQGDRTPLVLVRCCLCGEVQWVAGREPVFASCHCRHLGRIGRQPTLAEADRGRRADAA